MGDTIVGLAELVLVVSDVRRCAAFYRDVLGLEHEPETSRESDGWAWFRLESPANEARPQRLALRQGSLLFEERSPRPEGSRWGPVHFALHAPRERIDAALERARQAGADVLGPVRLEWMRANAWYFFDPEGNLAELWSPDPASAEP
ncbi:MAG: VOC family protein [Planctomycetota bacterium]|nr:VOC family protein [Planctomycetota bacterium]